MRPFLPVGERARWRVIYDLLRKAKVGDVVTYREMAEALDLDAKRDRTKVQLAMRRAAKELETVDLHAVEPVVNEGYRIVEPEQHLDLARKHQRKAGRSLQRGHSKVVNVDFNGMPGDVRKAFEVVAGAFAAQIDFNRRLSVRQDHLERAVEAVTQQTGEQQQRTAEELEALRERLRRLEEKTPGSE
ncbi:MAG: hypothetical protein AB7V59_21795 [Gammaproteobacteria bacterium]